MKITMTTTVEDTNSQIVEEEDKDVVVYHTDKLLDGKTYDLPKRQAERLVKFGHAKASK